LASRYCHDEFTRQYFPTAGVDFFLKRTVLSGAGNITLQIWDVGGQSLAGNMLDKYIFGANVSREHSITVTDRNYNFVSQIYLS
jgi:Ras-related protein Rab-28